MSFLKYTWWRCLLSPRLYKEYNYGINSERSDVYKPKALEKWMDRYIYSLELIWNMGLVASPIILYLAVRRGYMTIEYAKDIMGTVGCISCTVFAALFFRAISRASNATYVRFIDALYQPSNNMRLYLEGLRKFDFETYALPVSYAVKTNAKVSTSRWLEKNPFMTSANCHLPIYQRYPLQILSYFAVHTFGIRMIYPGSFGILHYLIMDQLIAGRAYLVEECNGLRAKIQTADNNLIDTMHVDHRGVHNKGTILVICCEGNSGFYEIGIMNTAVKAGYSALGWNHPGFAESTGLPYPQQEQYAMDAVMKYAIEVLNYTPKNIVLFGWSIGGYTAAYGALQYPDVNSLILDAIFDDLLPLALHVMPPSWSSLVREVVRSYVDLNIVAMILNFRGRVFTIRRTDDEIICLTQGDLSSNRLNNFLLKLINHRHPEISDLNKPELTKYINISEFERNKLNTSSNSSAELKNILSTISMYTRDYKGTHCSPLPDHVFEDVVYRASILQSGVYDDGQ